MRSRQAKHISGFTLLEVLIALSIFAVIGLAAYRVLDTVILSQQAVQTHSTSLRQIQRAMLFISLDIEQAVNRSVRGPYDEEIQSMVAGQGDYLLELTRQGWRNPLNLPRSNLQRVAYELGSLKKDRDEESYDEPDELALLRHYWPVLDQPQDSEPKTQKLLGDIEDVQFRFLDDQGEWRAEWPFNKEEGVPMTLPVALEVLFDTRQYGEIKRIYQLGRVQDEDEGENRASAG